MGSIPIHFRHLGAPQASIGIGATIRLARRRFDSHALPPFKGTAAVNRRGCCYQASQTAVRRRFDSHTLPPFKGTAAVNQGGCQDRPSQTAVHAVRIALLAVKLCGCHNRPSQTAPTHFRQRDHLRRQSGWVPESTESDGGQTAVDAVRVALFGVNQGGCHETGGQTPPIHFRHMSKSHKRRGKV